MPRIRHTLAFVFALAVLLAAVHGVRATAQQPPPAPPAYVLIVHPENRSATVSRSFVADAFMKKVTRWNDGTSLRPVDLSGTPAIRRQFSRDVLRRSVEALRSYWQQLIFSGRGLPPVEVSSEDDVVRYVLRNRGGIGYVSGSARLRGARVVTLR
jgi:hypothetical protein